jgi:CD36 family.
MTSTPLSAHRRMQLSIALHKIDKIDLMQEAPTIILPILWIDEVGIFLIQYKNKLESSLCRN